MLFCAEGYECVLTLPLAIDTVYVGGEIIFSISPVSHSSVPFIINQDNTIPSSNKNSRKFCTITLGLAEFATSTNPHTYGMDTILHVL